jgi:type IV secretory pathway VirD2 relaxase
MAATRDDLHLEVQPPRRRRRQTPLRRPPRSSARGRYGHPSRRAVAVLRRPGPRLQRSTVKASYTRNRRPGSWGAHGAYLAREGAQREGEHGLGFDRERTDLDVAATVRAWQAAGDERLWKFVVSPENGAQLDLREHARRLVGHMERDLGTPLEWVAVDHYNTDNPHVHLLVRGRERDGGPLWIPREYLTSGLRYRSEELATDRLGLRSDREMLRARGQAVERAQFTELDQALLRHAGADRIVTVEPPAFRWGRALEFRQQELRRLQFLAEAGLARKVGAHSWELLPQMETALRQAQLATDIVKSRARHHAHLSDPRMPLVLTSIEHGTRVTGRVIGTGLADELHDRRYLLLEGTDGRLHYIPQPPAVERAREMGQLRVGEVVTLTGTAIDRDGRQIIQTQIEVHAPKTRVPGRSVEPAGRVPESPSFPELDQVARGERRRIQMVPALDGLLYRGRLVGYARERDGQRYAVVDIGRELVALRTDDVELVAGREVRVEGRQVTDAQGRRRQIWRLGPDQREHHSDNSTSRPRISTRSDNRSKGVCIVIDDEVTQRSGTPIADREALRPPRPSPFRFVIGPTR